MPFPHPKSAPFDICHRQLRKRCVDRPFVIEPPILLVDKSAVGLRLVRPSVFVAGT